MDITRTYEISPETFFDVLRNSLAADYRNNTQQEVPSQLVGVTYIKTLDSKNRHTVRVTIEQYEPPVAYVALIISNRGRTRIGYHMSPLAEGRTTVRYQEETEPNGLLARWNAWLLTPLMNRSIKARMEAQLDRMVAYAKQQEGILSRANEEKQNQ